MKRLTVLLLLFAGGCSNDVSDKDRKILKDWIADACACAEQPTFDARSQCLENLPRHPKGFPGLGDLSDEGLDEFQKARKLVYECKELALSIGRPEPQ